MKGLNGIGLVSRWKGTALGLTVRAGPEGPGGTTVALHAAALHSPRTGSKHGLHTMEDIQVSQRYVCMNGL